MDMRNPNQIFHVIDIMIHNAVERMVGTSYSEIQLTDACHQLNVIFDLLYSIRYHQRQFLFRLRLLHLQQLFNKPVTGNPSIIMIDIPLRCELEAFISKTRSLLDVSAKLISCVMEPKKQKHGDLLKHLEASHSKGIKKDLHDLYKQYNEWIKLLKPLREHIQHDGTFSEFRSFEHEKGFLVSRALMT